METVFIRQIGIHPWDQLHPSHDENYITVTLLNQDYAGVWKTWCEFSSRITINGQKLYNGIHIYRLATAKAKSTFYKRTFIKNHIQEIF